MSQKAANDLKMMDKKGGAELREGHDKSFPLNNLTKIKEIGRKRKIIGDTMKYFSKKINLD